MKKPITEKYYIASYIGDLFEHKEKVTKKVFLEQVNHNLNVAYATNCTPMNIEGYSCETEISDRGSYIETVTTCQYGCSEIRFIKRICKNGYHFTNNK